ncbi:MAG: peptide-binding protein [Eubacteriaceae bacterium]|nr:peptide-binding protein [Eubacteriaceae bacterium]
MKRRFKPVLAMLLVIILLLSSCGKAKEPEEEKHLNVAIYWNAHVNPFNGWGGWWTMRYGIGETLLTMDKDMNLVECLADSYSIEDSGTTFRFHIRKGVKFSNGAELTPKHVIESIQKTAVENSRGYQLKLASAEVDGEYAVFHTTEPYAAFIYVITEPMCIVVDTDEDMSNFDIYPICTGPYKVIDHVPDEKWELEANEYYWKGVAKIKYITNYNIAGDTRIQALISGQIDMAYSPSTATLSLMEGYSNLKRIDALGTRESDIAINCREGRPTADKNLRLALAYALDRAVLAQVSGNGTSEPLAKCFPDSTGYDLSNVKAPDYDVEKAKEYLEKAGYTQKNDEGYVLDKDGNELVLKILLSSSSNTAVFVSMIDMWKAVGIHVELDPMESVSDKRQSGDFDILGNAGWQTMNNGDGQSYMTNRWSDAGTDNYSGYHSDEFEAIIAKLNNAFTPEERAKVFGEAAQIIADDCPAIFYAATANYDVINTDKLNDIEIYPIDYYVLDNTWTMK